MAALVTGAGQRIGRALALRLAERGYDVAVHYSSSEEGALQTVSEIRKLGRHAEAIQADLLDEADTNSLVREACRAVGKLSVLVNNASIFEEDSFMTTTRTSWERHMRSNLWAPFVLMQGFAAQVPGAADDGEPLAQGLIVNMIDQRVLKLTPHFTTYTLAKSALWTLTRTAAQALAPQVRVNAIGPGPTLKGARQTQEDFLRQRSATVLKRGADTYDVSAALDYLLQARAVTGQLICPDGGQHLAWETPDVVGVE
ncbi:SDR family oxidoreductase [Paracoccus tibetensis]|uniref:NAD(P)-dependent dehydrogenase, short-chain alcohol dehydrogenase family n=1 Tax=Paracoccus tibetensis TaxID=336292 RepID=A0A1G5DPB2_9RHOB|nr:SDR family oxidoreductase [Paracoccus tibetensis]SCY16300.1 NAD(P)-dependent dehydrogenase, short-chain alcohol dehydrogenase family [Paracoccus tibetensis]